MPVWLADEGRIDLPDDRCIWDWINIILGHMWYSFQNPEQRKKEKRTTYCKINLTTQSKLSNPILPTKMQAISIRLKKNWNFFMNKNFKVSSFAHGHYAGCEHGEKSAKYFLLIWRKGNTSKNICENSELIRSNDAEDNKNVKKTIGLISKTTTSHVHHTFLYISFPFLHDYNVKMPNVAFYGGPKQATTKFYFS